MSTRFLRCIRWHDRSPVQCVNYIASASTGNTGALTIALAMCMQRCAMAAMHAQQITPKHTPVLQGQPDSQGRWIGDSMGRAYLVMV